MTLGSLVAWLNASIARGISTHFLRRPRSAGLRSKQATLRPHQDFVQIRAIRVKHFGIVVLRRFLKVSSIETRHLSFQRLPYFVQFGNLPNPKSKGLAAFKAGSQIFSCWFQWFQTFHKRW